MSDEPKSPVGTISPEIEADQKKHALCRALRAGTPKLRELALKGQYMVPHPGEMEPVRLGSEWSGNLRSWSVANGVTTAYHLRVATSADPGTWPESIAAIARQPFQDPVVLGGWNPAIMGTCEDGDRVEKGTADNIDLEGRNLTEYLQRAFEEKLFEGAAYTLVDADPRTFSSAGSRRVAGARSRAIYITRDSVKEIQYGRDESGKTRLLQFRYATTIREESLIDGVRVASEIPVERVVRAGDLSLEWRADGAVGLEGDPRVTVLTFKPPERDGADWEELEELRAAIVPADGAEFRDIPLVPHLAKRIAPYRGESPFLRTAELGQVLWNLSSETRGVVRQAMEGLFRHVSGFSEGVDGPETPGQPDTAKGRTSTTTNAESTQSIYEVRGYAVENLVKLMGNFEKLIEKRHSTIKSDRAASATATEVRVDGFEVVSALHLWAHLEEAAGMEILRVMSILDGYSESGTVTLPADLGFDSPEMDRLKELYQTGGGGMSALNYWGEAKERGDVNGKLFSLDAELRREALHVLTEAGELSRALETPGLVEKVIALLQPRDQEAA